VPEAREDGMIAFHVIDQWIGLALVGLFAGVVVKDVLVGVARRRRG
jgi:hypothetical protein